MKIKAITISPTSFTKNESYILNVLLNQYKKNGLIGEKENGICYFFK